MHTCRGTCAILLLVLLALQSRAQTVDSTVVQMQKPGVQVPVLDERAFFLVYRPDGPVMTAYMEGVNALSLPVFIGVPVATWGHAWLGGGGADAYRLTLSEGLTFAAVAGLKRLVRRPRPYEVLPEVWEHRSERETHASPLVDTGSFPSGDVAVAAAATMSLGLSHPEWYVILPGVVWTASVSLSRIWHGMHFPSDALAGVVLGSAIAYVIHQLGPHITPSFLQEDAEHIPTLIAVRLVL